MRTRGIGWSGIVCGLPQSSMIAIIMCSRRDEYADLLGLEVVTRFRLVAKFNKNIYQGYKNLPKIIHTNKIPLVLLVATCELISFVVLFGGIFVRRTSELPLLSQS